MQHLEKEEKVITRTPADQDGGILNERSPDEKFTVKRLLLRYR